MNLQELPFFSMVTKRMAWLTMRQQVLAQNIANADTPNYKPMDLTQQSFRKMLAPQRPSMEMMRTTGNHIEQMPRSIKFRAEKARTTHETAPSGNAVVLLIGALARMFMSTLHMAGVMIGMQVSLANAQLFDPVNATQSSVIATFLNLLGIFLVFAADLHHLMLLAVVDSYAVFAPGAALPLADATEIAVRMMSRAFSVAMQLSAPFIVVGILFYLGLGLVARLMPAVQVFFIAMPLQIVIGFLVMIMMLSSGMMWFLGHFENVFTGQNLLGRG